MIRKKKAFSIIYFITIIVHDVTRFRIIIVNLTLDFRCSAPGTGDRTAAAVSATVATAAAGERVPCEGRVTAVPPLAGVTTRTLHRVNRVRRA